MAVSKKELEAQITDLKDELNKKELENVRLTLELGQASTLEASFDNIAVHLHQDGFKWDFENRMEVPTNVFSYIQGQLINGMCFITNMKLNDALDYEDDKATEARQLKAEEGSVRGNSAKERADQKAESARDGRMALEQVLQAAEAAHLKYREFAFKRIAPKAPEFTLASEMPITEEERQEKIRRDVAAGYLNADWTEADYMKSDIWPKLPKDVKVKILGGDQKLIRWFNDSEATAAWIAKQDATKPDAALQTNGVATSQEDAADMALGKQKTYEQTEGDRALGKIASEGQSAKVA